MLFRPEDVHRASSIGGILKPFPEGHGHISHKIPGISPKNLPIANFYLNRKPAIQTRGIDPYCFPGEEPADCQRFEGSLTKPSLLSVNGDSVLSGKVVERGKRGDIGRVRIQPSGNTWCGQ